jgi:thioredoxin 1
MNKGWKVVVVVALGVAVVVVVMVKQADRHHAQPPGPTGTSKPATASAPASQSATVSTPASGRAEQTASLPRLVDLGSVNCIPCKQMAPILDRLRKDFAGRLEVMFIDVWADPDAGRAYGIRVIPTQLFFDAAGNERFRHEGFMSREDILGVWRELGVDLEPSAR